MPTTQDVENTVKFEEVKTEVVDPVSTRAFQSDLMPCRPEAPLAAGERMYLVNELTWSTADAVDHVVGSLQFPKLLFQIPFIADKLAGYTYGRAGVRIRVVINGNKYVYGKLLIGWDSDSASDGASIADLSISQLSCGPHFLVDATQPETLEIRLPWTHPVPYWTVPTVPPDIIGTVIVKVLVPLVSVSAASAAASIPVQIFAAFEDLCLAGPTSSATAPS